MPSTWTVVDVASCGWVWLGLVGVKFLLDCRRSGWVRLGRSLDVGSIDGHRIQKPTILVFTHTRLSTRQNLIRFEKAAHEQLEKKKGFNIFA